MVGLDVKHITKAMCLLSQLPIPEINIKGQEVDGGMAMSICAKTNDAEVYVPLWTDSLYSIL